MVAVTEFMDFTWSYITDFLQNVKSLTIFEDFVVQGQGLVNWSSRTRTFLEYNNNDACANCQFYFRYTGKESCESRFSCETFYQDKSFTWKWRSYILPEGKWSAGVHGKTRVSCNEHIWHCDSRLISLLLSVLLLLMLVRTTTAAVTVNELLVTY